MKAKFQAFFEDRKTAIFSMIFSGLLYLTGEGVDVQMADWFGMSLATADKITDVAKFLTTVTAALGFSVIPQKKAPSPFDIPSHDAPKA